MSLGSYEDLKPRLDKQRADLEKLIADKKETLEGMEGEREVAQPGPEPRIDQEQALDDYEDQVDMVADGLEDEDAFDELREAIDDGEDTGPALGKVKQSKTYTHLCRLWAAAVVDKEHAGPKKLFESLFVGRGFFEDTEKAFAMVSRHAKQDAKLPPTAKALKDKVDAHAGKAEQVKKESAGSGAAGGGEGGEPAPAPGGGPDGGLSGGGPQVDKTPAGEAPEVSLDLPPALAGYMEAEAAHGLMDDTGAAFPVASEQVGFYVSFAENVRQTYADDFSGRLGIVFEDAARSMLGAGAEGAVDQGMDMLILDSAGKLADMGLGSKVPIIGPMITLGQFAWDHEGQLEWMEGEFQEGADFVMSLAQLPERMEDVEDFCDVVGILASTGASFFSALSGVVDVLGTVTGLLSAYCFVAAGVLSLVAILGSLVSFGGVAAALGPVIGGLIEVGLVMAQIATALGMASLQFAGTALFLRTIAATTVPASQLNDELIGVNAEADVFGNKAGAMAADQVGDKLTDSIASKVGDGGDAGGGETAAARKKQEGGEAGDRAGKAHLDDIEGVKKDVEGLASRKKGGVEAEGSRKTGGGGGNALERFKKARVEVEQSVGKARARFKSGCKDLDSSVRRLEELSSGKSEPVEQMKASDVERRMATIDESLKAVDSGGLRAAVEIEAARVEVKKARERLDQLESGLGGDQDGQVKDRRIGVEDWGEFTELTREMGDMKAFVGGASEPTDVVKALIERRAQLIERRNALKGRLDAIRDKREKVEALKQEQADRREEVDAARSELESFEADHEELKQSREQAERSSARAGRMRAGKGQSYVGKVVRVGDSGRFIKGADGEVKPAEAKARVVEVREDGLVVTSEEHGRMEVPWDMVQGPVALKIIGEAHVEAARARADWERFEGEHPDLVSDHDSSRQRLSEAESKRDDSSNQINRLEAELEESGEPQKPNAIGDFLEKDSSGNATGGVGSAYKALVAFFAERDELKRRVESLEGVLGREPNDEAKQEGEGEGEGGDWSWNDVLQPGSKLHEAIDEAWVPTVGALLANRPVGSPAAMEEAFLRAYTATTLYNEKWGEAILWAEGESLMRKRVEQERKVQQEGDLVCQEVEGVGPKLEEAKAAEAQRHDEIEGEEVKSDAMSEGDGALLVAAMGKLGEWSKYLEGDTESSKASAGSVGEAAPSAGADAEASKGAIAEGSGAQADRLHGMKEVQGAIAVQVDQVRGELAETIKRDDLSAEEMAQRKDSALTQAQGYGEEAVSASTEFNGALSELSTWADDFRTQRAAHLQG